MGKNRITFWIIALGTFISLFVCQFLYEHTFFQLKNFNDRTIGIAVLNGIDVAARSTYFIKLIAVFNIILFSSIFIFNKIRLKILEKIPAKDIQDNENRIFTLSILSIFTLLFHYVNGSELFVSVFTIFKILILLNFIVYISTYFFKRFDKTLFKVFNNKHIVNVSFLFPIIILYIRWLIINGSFTFSEKVIPFYFGLWFVYWILVTVFFRLVPKKLFDQYIESILKSSVPILLIPFAIKISNEIQYSISQSIVITSREIALYCIAVLIILSTFIFLRNKNKYNKFNFSKYYYFPIMLSTITLFNLHTNYLEINYLDIFHNGENLISNHQLFEFGRIPFIHIYPTHGLSYLFSQVLYSVVNGYQTFAPWLWEWIPKIFEIILLYFVLAKITNSFFSVLTISFLPFIGIFGGQALVYGYSRSMPTTYYLTAFFAGLILVNLKKINFSSTLLIWISCLLTTFWRIDFGIASFVSAGVMLLIETFGQNKTNSKKTADLLTLFKSLLITLFLTFLIFISLCLFGKTSPLDVVGNVYQFIKFQAQAQGLVSVATYTPMAIFQYLILPSVSVYYIASYLYMVFIRKEHSISNYKKLLVYTAIFSLIIFIRSFQRQTLSILGYNPYLFVFLLICLPLFIKKVKSSIILFVLGLFVYQLVLPNANMLLKMGQTVTFINWKNKESRVRVNDYQYKNISNFINSNLEDNQTFIDLSSSPLLYVVTNRRFINYLIPSAYYTSDLIQNNVINQISSAYKSNEVPIVILRQPIPDANSIDGVPNEIRSYKIYEFIYQNYKPAGYIDGYMIWTANGFTLKDNKDVLKSGTVINDANLGKLPYYWGEYDQHKITAAQNITKDTIKLLANKPEKIPINQNNVNVTSNYINIKVISKSAGSMKINYGESSHITFDLIQSEKPINYMIRISTQYNWQNQIKKDFQLISSVNSDVVEINLLTE